MNNKPGLGWIKTMHGSVFDHASGIRIHTGGCLCRFPNGDIVVGVRHPESINLDQNIRVAGGNRKRGVMVWALALRENSEQK